MMRIIGLIIYSIPVLVLLYFIAVYFRTKVPYVRTSKKYFLQIAEAMNIKSDSVIYDLGCGSGRLLFYLEKYHPKKLVGYELSPMHALYGKIRKLVTRSKVSIYYHDFLKADLSGATDIYLFLVQSVAGLFWKKYGHQLKSGTMIYVLGCKLPASRLIKEINLNGKSSFLRIYRVP